MQQRLRSLILKRLQSIRRARREVAGVTFCARTFQKPARYFCYCPTGPSRKAGREAPPRGYLSHGATLERLYDCVLACRVVSRGHVPLYAIMAVPVVATSRPRRGRRSRRGRVVPWLWHPGRVVPWPWPWRPPSFCRRRVVTTRRWMLVFAMVLAWSMLTQFALHT